MQVAVSLSTLVMMSGLFLGTFACKSYAAPNGPQELGDVAWLRDFEQAKAQSKQSGKPILILFDEVPGCGTCVRYGQAVLSHPLLVEAAETLFVPVAIYNNTGGKDRKVLKSFGEPTWNNPVVRIVDHARAPMSARIAGDYSLSGLTTAMIGALKKAGRSVPKYLELLHAEQSAPQTQRATFSMYCFWSGEVCLGEAEGVVRTSPGFLSGREVVEVEFDPSKLSYADLLHHAKSRSCADGVFTRNAVEERQAQAVFKGRAHQSGDRARASRKDDKYQLRHTAWRFVPMTDLQRSKANALIGRRQSPASVLSPRQIAMHKAIVANPSAGWDEQLAVKDLRTAFRTAITKAGPYLP